MKLNFSFCYRKKKYDASKNGESAELPRVLNLLDLTTLGVSCTLGSGVYVIIGNIIAWYAGPSVIFSLIIAGICSFLAGLCYAEIGARIPRSGSAYAYVYETIGEFIAFIIGWDLILEYVIGTSAAASTLSKYVDHLADYQISRAFRNAMPMNYSDIFASYPDWLAWSFCILIIILLIVGVKDSSFLNKTFTAFNILVIFFIIICGLIKSDIKNWQKETYPNLSWTNPNGTNSTCKSSNRCGNGGFAPFGLSGVIKGAAKCFFVYIGFDCIASTGDEVKNPKRNIPLSILITIFTVGFCYVGVSMVLTLMIPYFILDLDSPIQSAFNYVNLSWASLLISIGAIISLITCLYASMFPMPRIAYSMAFDGLIFKPLSYIAPKVKTPAVAAIFTGVLASLLTLIFNLEQLIDMMSIGTLLAYSIVSACCLILRYKPFAEETVVVDDPNAKKTIVSYIFGHSEESLFQRLFYPAPSKCSKCSSHLVTTIVLLSMVDIVLICILYNFADFSLPVSYVFLIIFLTLLSILTYIIWVQPQNENITTFKVPFVPFFPLLSAFFNIYLIITLSLSTWVRFFIWFAIGLIVYFGYGIRHSKLSEREVSYVTMEEPNVLPQETVYDNNNNNESVV